MSMNMGGEHCPNCGEDLEEGQIGLCEDCGGDRLSGQGDERCADCNELRDETSNSTHQQWECCACGSWNDNRTHGSPELDEDARKLEAMGQDAGPTLADLDPKRAAERAMKLVKSLLNGVQVLVAIIEANQDAWQGEEDSVKEEHADLIALNAKTLIAAKTLEGL